MELDSGRHEPLTDGDSSIIEPRWARDGALYYLDDRAGWWQLYRQAGDSSVRICDYPADIGRPPWQLAQAHHVNARDDGTIAVSVDSARCSLVDIRPSGRVRNIEVQEVDITQLQVRGDDVWYLGSREDRPAAICRVDTDRGTTERVVDEGACPDPDCVSRPEPVMASGPQGIVHGHLYRPCCPGTRGPGDRPPPLVVRAHGGPTAMRSPAWNPEVQFWTGHGIAVVEVNYGGSSGHGRSYRERLRRRWGIADRDDCICMAKTLAAEGLCDIQEMFIAGNSAGGLTVLNALRHSDLFRAGLCRWAVTDLARLATLTHRFERGYLDFLVGDRKTSASCYAERSPAAHAHEITAPVLLIQGDADRIVPVSQATAMADAMTVNGGKAELHIYPGEGHGLRRAENIRSAAETELAFVRGLIEHQGSG
ncbi:S9 family peptidase [Spiribacter onubensis]|uniref:Prolyl oligopeptidase family serine peptidase n=1 Tax=Spiribacter onubensis TaxID=3122420 RepID=A0ABV3S7M4_9GAMM